MQRLALLTVALAALVATGAVTAAATSGTSGVRAQATGPSMGSVGMKLTVSKFVKSARSLIAHGMATAT